MFLTGSKLDKALVIGAWFISVITTIFYLPFTKGSERGCVNKFPKEMIKVSIANYKHCKNPETCPKYGHVPALRHE